MIHHMRSARRASSSRRGIIQAAVAGAAGVTCIIGLTLAAAAPLGTRAVRSAADDTAADFAANAGIQDAIARLREMARTGAEYPCESDGTVAAWYTWMGTAGGGSKLSYPTNEAVNGLDDDDDGLTDAADADELATDVLDYTDWVASTHVDGGDTYRLRVVDTASRININAGDNLGTVLDNLCRVIGPPLVAADQAALVPKWYADQDAAYADPLNATDVSSTSDLFYQLDAGGRPVFGVSAAIYGDGYAIAGYRARNGEFTSIDDVRDALTWIERADGDTDGDTSGVEVDTAEEAAEIEAKFAALRPYITTTSWRDTNQVGYGKFEHVVVAGGRAVALVDRNRTWDTTRHAGDGELAGCFVSIVSGVGAGQIKRIASNTIDTIHLDDAVHSGSEMRTPPNIRSSYIIVAEDIAYGEASGDAPLSIHRAPVNVNTASDKVLTALLMGLQTTWGPAGYPTRTNLPTLLVGDASSLCPSILSIGRNADNATLLFGLPCPNDSTFTPVNFGTTQSTYGHPSGGAPYCFMCNDGNPCSATAAPGHVGEAHYLAWQIMKEREQTDAQDRALDGAFTYSNGSGPFKGWDALYFRAFLPWERGLTEELAVGAAPMPGVTGLGAGCHPGIARLLMANFNANTDVLKFQPNIEWINRWGVNFTELYLPRPELLVPNQTAHLQVRPGELLDKTDLNIGTTEFCFGSGGVYEIESTGRVRDATGIVAEKRYLALVRVYDVWRESTQREFVAGTLSGALGALGTQRAGQAAVHGVSAGSPGGNSSATREALCTYPEPIVPGDTVGAGGMTPPLAISSNPSGPRPARYDGQIMLATNTLMSQSTPVAGDDITFYSSFTGEVAADHAAADPAPVTHLGVLPLDHVPLLGERDGTDVDVAPVMSAGGDYIEGVGKTGDLRADGVYLGSTLGGPADPRDGSFEFNGSGNIDYGQGSVSMWVKPNWHHGTYRAATLPVSYLADLLETASCVSMKQWANWPAAFQMYANDTDRNPIGYVRERFEHEFFNASIPEANSWAQGFTLRKTGDVRNTLGNMDMPEGGPNGTSPFGALHLFLENSADQNFTSWIPGWTVSGHATSVGDNRPYYRFCPFRWFFVGCTWNYTVLGRSMFSAGANCPYGQLREATGGGYLSIESGGTWGDMASAASTPENHASLVLQGRPFVDSMRYFHTAALDSFPGDDLDEKLESWAYELHGTSYQWGTFPFGVPAPFNKFGVNRPAPAGEHVYQRVTSGTHATVDEFTISGTWRDARVASSSGFTWAADRRRAFGRYYRATNTGDRPTFTSQSLLASEYGQGGALTGGDASTNIELGCVRWYSFAPYYCLDTPGLSGHSFPLDSYFLETTGTPTTTSQSNRVGPTHWATGAESRNSPHRGISISIISGSSAEPADAAYEYTDPEGWEPIYAQGGAATGTHARSAPMNLRYAVRFGWSNQEYSDINADTVVLDSPVFDEVAITYLRPPVTLDLQDLSGTTPLPPHNHAPVVDAGLDDTVYRSLGAVAGLAGTVTDDGLPEDGTLTQLWELVSGPGTVTFADATATHTTTTFSTDGAYTLSLTASDGDLTGSDTVTITVAPVGPGVRVVTPNGGEIWYVGMDYTIAYEATGIPEVEILYTKNGGADWNTIDSSVTPAHADWLSHTWTVPDSPSTSYLVEVGGTLGEATDRSNATFEIRAFVDSDGDDMPDDWEQEHGLDDTVDDAALDADGDGVSNLNEFLAGTDPTIAPAGGDDDDDGCGTVASGHVGFACALALGALVVLLGRRRRTQAAT